MHIVFYSTSDVFKGEELLIQNHIDCKVVPTPVTDKAYCGVCLEISSKADIEALQGIEYKIIAEV